MEIYFSFSGFFNAVASTLLGLFIFFKDKRNPVNRSFAFFCFSVALWSYPYIMWPISKTRESTLFWFQLLHIGACFTSIAYLHFVAIWLGIKKKIKKVIYVGYVLSVGFALSVFSLLFIADMVPKFSMRYWAEPGVLYPFYLLYFLGYAIYSTYLLAVHYRLSVGVKKAQIRLILIGIAMAFIGGSTNYFLWYNINIPPYGNILASTYVILTAYAIVAHKLMDIKWVFRKYSVYIISLISILPFIFIIRHVFNILSPGYSAFSELIIVIIAISAYPYFQKYFYRLANKYFFSSLYDSQSVITNISNQLRSTLEVEKIFEGINKTLAEAFHFKMFSILSYNEKRNNYKIQYNNNFDLKGFKSFEGNKYLQSYFISEDRPFLIEELQKKFSNPKTNKSIALLENYKIELIVPLNIKGKIIGLMVFGSKESRDMYNEEDIRVLNIVSSQAAIAIENALLYKKTKDFNLKLKMEVEKATSELKLANQELKQLDRAKSEFISIASHQLRTPLTAIKGYISMILEGDFGKTNHKVNDALTDVYASNERLIDLINNLLDISRMESGRMQYSYEQTSLDEMVESVYKELGSMAIKKNLKFTLDKPEKPLPKVYVDQEKIRQVVLNLMDNAIKYTEQGFVKVSIKRDGKYLVYCVTDSGRGVSANDLSNLFKKFSRGTGSSVVHTEGTGLGLYVARQMIEAHHGEIWAESDGEWKGSRFCFKLPVKSRKVNQKK